MHTSSCSNREGVVIVVATRVTKLLRACTALCVHVCFFPMQLAACSHNALLLLLLCCTATLLCCACPPLSLCAASCVCDSLQCVTACPLLSCSKAWAPGQSPATARPTGGLCALGRAGSLALPASSVAGMNGCWTHSRGAAPHQQVRLCGVESVTVRGALLGRVVVSRQRQRGADKGVQRGSQGVGRWVGRRVCRWVWRGAGVPLCLVSLPHACQQQHICPAARLCLLIMLCAHMCACLLPFLCCLFACSVPGHPWRLPQQRPLPAHLCLHKCWQQLCWRV